MRVVVFSFCVVLVMLSSLPSHHMLRVYPRHERSGRPSKAVDNLQDGLDELCGAVNGSAQTETQTAGVQKIHACEYDDIVLTCPVDFEIQVKSALYGRIEAEICPSPGSSDLKCNLDVTQIVTSRCGGQQQCQFSAENDIFTDPCVETTKYLEVDFECKKGTKQRHPQTTGQQKAFTCAESDIQITCPANFEVQVSTAYYGRAISERCDHVERGQRPGGFRSDCALNVTHTLISRCDGRQRCRFTVGNNKFPDPCWSHEKYLEVHFKCIKEGSQKTSQTAGLQIAFTCERYDIEMTCPVDSEIQVWTAYYGRTTADRCGQVKKGQQLNGFRPDCTSNVINTVTGRCGGQQKCQFTAGNGIFNDPCSGHEKYLEVQFDCIKEGSQKTSQTAGLQTAFACERSDIKMTCPAGFEIKVLSAQYGRTITDRSSHKKSDQYPSSFHSNCGLYVTNTVTSRCDGQEICQFTAKDKIFTNPCHGYDKYLEVHFDCFTELEYKVAYACKGDTLLLACQPWERIVVKGANYGRGSDPDRCIRRTTTSPSSCGSNVTEAVAAKCEGHIQCGVSVTDTEFSASSCGNTENHYLEVSYYCDRSEDLCADRRK